MTHAIYFDRKPDMLGAVHKGALVLPYEEFRINPLLPPHPLVDCRHWRNIHARSWTEMNDFLSRGQSLYMQGSDQVYKRFGVYENWKRWDWKTMTFPTMHDLYRHFASQSFAKTTRGGSQESRRSIVDKLGALLTELGPVFDCQKGFSLENLYRQGKAVVLVLDGLSLSSQNFLILTIWLSYYHLFKTLGIRGKLNVVLFFDEAKSLFGLHVRAFTLFDLIAKSREFGISLAVADQSPALLSQYLWSNVGTVVGFRSSDGNDIRRMRVSLAATHKQSIETHAFKPGEASMRTARYQDLFRVQVPYVAMEKCTSREEVAAIMAPELASLQEHVIPADERAENRYGTKPIDSKDSLAEDQRTHLEFLARGGMELASSKVSKKLGLTQSKGYRIKQTLLKKGLISQVRTNLGKGGRQVKMLIPSRLALDALGIEIPPGKGEILHKHFQKRAKEKAEHQGWKAEIEFGEGREAVDVAIEKNNLRVAVEFSITSKPQTEADNIKKAINLGFDLVVLCFVHTRVKNRAEEIAKATYPAKTLERVRFVLAHEFDSVIRELEEWKQS